jgi:anti-anti-sigma regulatory factor
VQIVAGKEHKVLHLRGFLGMANGPALRDAALKMALGPAGADAASRIHVEAGELEGADASILQVLAAFEAESQRRGRTLAIGGLRASVELQWQAAGWPGFSRRS